MESVNDNLEALISLAQKHPVGWIDGETSRPYRRPYRLTPNLQEDAYDFDWLSQWEADGLFTIGSSRWVESFLESNSLERCFALFRGSVHLINVFAPHKKGVTNASFTLDVQLFSGFTESVNYRFAGLSRVMESKCSSDLSVLTPPGPTPCNVLETIIHWTICNTTNLYFGNYLDCADEELLYSRLGLDD